MLAKILFVLLACLGCDGPRPAPVRPTPPTTEPVLTMVIRCDGTPMYPGPGVPAALELQVLGARPLGAAIVQVVVDGGPPRRLHAAFETEQQWLRRGYDAVLLGTLMESPAAELVGELRFSERVRDNRGAMPTEDQILRGWSTLHLDTAAGAPTPYALACAAPIGSGRDARQ